MFLNRFSIRSLNQREDSTNFVEEGHHIMERNLNRKENAGNLQFLMFTYIKNSQRIKMYSGEMNLAHYEFNLLLHANCIILPIILSFKNLQTREKS